VKVSPWFAANAASGRSKVGFVAIFDAETGYTTAIIDDRHLLSDLRTAAAALAARFLAPARVHTAVVVGTGAQAFWQPQALARERTVGRLLVWGRNKNEATISHVACKRHCPTSTSRLSPISAARSRLLT
jgi:ornithine cyclodeaminase/alanine dehydrogenase-like protein (mu-crystallin family)